MLHSLCCAPADSRVHHFQHNHKVTALLLSMSDKRNVLFSHRLTPLWRLLSPDIINHDWIFSASFCSLFNSPLWASPLSQRDGWAVRIDLVSKRATASKADEHRPLKRLTGSHLHVGNKPQGCFHSISHKKQSNFKQLNGR